MLTPAELIRRAAALRPLLRSRQADCEALGRVPDDVNAELVRGGFYRIIQPRRFGGYEFDVPTFYRVMMGAARGCPETGWVLALTAGHPLIAASFPLEGQHEVYGKNGEFRCPAAFNPPGVAVPVAGGFRISGSWPSASGIDHATHAMTSAMVQADGEGAGRVIQAIFERAQFRIIDDWQVMGMRGTGSKRIAVEDAFVPLHRTVEAVAPGRGAEPRVRPRLHDNPMYLGRILCFLVGEAASVAVGAARGALDLYEDILRNKRAYHPPYQERGKEPEFQQHYGRALALIATAEAALVRAGEDYMEFARGQDEGGRPFDDERDQQLILVEQQCIRLAWEAADLMFRSAGTSDAAKEGTMLGRIYRNMAVINTHPALQLERTAIVAARTRLGLTPAAAPGGRGE
ncbi:MAG: oxidoreductase [Bradyrhizobiaceae bacterium]|nr:oxidoreductase [Bradyrhizobiaceae bacterium]